jgi:hypothetical protein
VKSWIWLNAESNEEDVMLYNLCLHLNGISVTTALAAATVFVLITLVKERKDERKRA